MKLIIDIPDEVLESKHYCRYFGAWSTKLTETIENGIPYEEGQLGDCISREALKKDIEENSIILKGVRVIEVDCAKVLIDNAPTVSEITKEKLAIAYEQGYEDGKNNWLQEGRPQGKWVKIFENPFTNGYVCPFCGHKIQVTEQFLPEVTECEACGAKMNGGAE